MSQLDELIANEHNMLIQSVLSWDKFTQNIFNILKEKFSGDEYMKVENILTDCINDVEDFSFTQGFVRGIAAVKGGAI